MSVALDKFSSYVEEIKTLSDDEKTALKAFGEVFYVAVIKEDAHHVLKHVNAIKADSPEKGEQADFFADVLQSVIAEDGRLIIETAKAIEDAAVTFN